VNCGLRGTFTETLQLQRAEKLLVPRPGPVTTAASRGASPTHASPRAASRMDPSPAGRTPINRFGMPGDTLSEDRAVDELRYKTAQRRRVERDTLMGLAGHEVSRWISIERGLRYAGYDEADIECIMCELMGAFKESPEAGQAKWQQPRKKVLRRRLEAGRRLPESPHARYLRSNVCNCRAILFL
jgi:hypothetical protein